MDWLRKVNSVTFPASANRTLVANFSQQSYTIATSALPPAGGSTSGGGTKICGASVTVIATASAGYTFANWTESGSAVSTSASYSFTASANRNLVANFTPILTTRIIALSGDLAFGNVIIGTTPQRTLTISNTGNSSLTVNRISYFGEEGTFFGAWNGTIPPGGTQNVTVTFKPWGEVGFSGFASVISDGTSGSSNIVVSGSGIQGCVASLLSPLPGATVVDPPAFSWSFNGPCSNKVYLSTLPDSDFVSLSNVFFAGTHSLEMTASRWSNVVANLGNVGTYYWTVGSADTLLALEFANWQPFTVVETPQTNQLPVIISPPGVTNAVLRVHNLSVVTAGQTNVFAVEATDPGGNALSYRWWFGDGATSVWSTLNTAIHAYSTTNCGPYSALVMVNNGSFSVVSNLVAATACETSVASLQVKLNFAKASADSCKLKAMPALRECGNFTGKLVTVDVGGARVSFTPLDAKGRGISPNRTCRLAFNSKTGVCNFTANLKHGSWQTPWAAHDLVNATIVRPVTLPVILVIDDEAFMADKPLQYTATEGKSGRGK